MLLPPHRHHIIRPTASEIAACAPCSRRLGGAGIRRGLRGGGALPFSPSQIAGLVLDLDGDKGIDIATGVTSWADQSSGTAHDAAQATAAKQPAYSASDAAFNGHGSVTGDGIDDVLVVPDHADLRGAGGITIYLVANHTSTGSPHYLLSKYNGAVGRTWIHSITAAGAVSTILRDSTDTTWISSGSGSADGSAAVSRFWWDPGSKTMTRYGAVEASSSATLAASNNGTANLGILAQPSAALPSAESIARILIYSRAVTAAEDTRIMAYLNAKYIDDISFSLGFDAGFQ